MAYRNNHTLSACLLRRFADGNSMIVRSNIVSAASMKIPVANQGFRKNLWRQTTAQLMEELWNDQAERDMSKVFKKLDLGSSLTLNDKKTIVRFMTIHYVRSNEFIKIYEGMHDRMNVTDFDSHMTFMQRYWLHLALLSSNRIPSEDFEDSIRLYYEKCLLYLSDFGLEIGVASDEESFILPDGGLYLMDFETRNSQPSNGVSLTRATNACMPLGPRHLAAFTTKTRKTIYRHLPDDHVAVANDNLKTAAINAFYRFPNVAQPI